MRCTLLAITLSFCASSVSFAQANSDDSWWNDSSVQAEVDSAPADVDSDPAPSPYEVLDPLTIGTPTTLVDEQLPFSQDTSSRSSLNEPAAIDQNSAGLDAAQLPEASAPGSQFTVVPSAVGMHSAGFGPRRSNLLMQMECGEAAGHTAWNGYAAERAAELACTQKHINGTCSCFDGKCSHGCSGLASHVCSGSGCGHCGKAKGPINRYAPLRKHRCSDASCAGGSVCGNVGCGQLSHGQFKLRNLLSHKCRSGECGHAACSTGTCGEAGAACGCESGIDTHSHPSHSMDSSVPMQSTAPHPAARFATQPGNNVSTTPSDDVSVGMTASHGRSLVVPR
jgi:hypothetical protein